MHPNILHNGRILSAGAPCLAAGQVGLLSGWGVFSTIKVIDGVLFAFERHWARMSSDAALMGVPMPEDATAVHAQLLELIGVNQARDATLRLVVVRNQGGMWEGPGERSYDVIALTAPTKQWGHAGRLGLVEHGRHAAGRFSRAKILSWAWNLAHLEEAQRAGHDEVCLLNEHGEVAECTSANIFVAKDGVVATPPLESGCLPGVTRDILLREVRVAGHTVTERVIQPGEFATADEVFITSTTRDLLPIASIGPWTIASRGEARACLQAAFNAYVAEYLTRHRR
ncbi:MAG: aminotransferase class IV [Bryobacterales bacterium]|nr:aminotransferase class IV [Bryobacterales bacterium]